MNRSRALRLRKESLTELSTAELDVIAAGNPTGPQPTPPIYALTYYCPTNFCVPLTYYCGG
jgi:hypothetical protein